jgi:actin-related protein 5
LIESIENVLKLFSKDVQNEMVKNIYLCGGNMEFKNIQNRIESGVRSIRPSESYFNVSKQNSIHDSWKGASQFSTLENFEQFCVSKKEYEGKMRLFNKNRIW